MVPRDERRGKVRRTERMRNRSEAILVKVEEEKEWLQVYKEVMMVKEILKESHGIRRTRTSDILIELRAGSEVKIVMTKLNEVIGDKVRATPMQDKVSIEINETDPLVSREELVVSIVYKLKIKDGSEVEVKTKRRGPSGTQLAIAVLPKVYIDKGGVNIRIRTGLTIATIRTLPNVINVLGATCLGITQINVKR